MASNPLLIKKDYSHKFVDLPHSAGILDDHAVRKTVNTKESYTQSQQIRDLTASKVVVSDANKNLASGTNTNTEISNAVTLAHSNATDHTRQHSITQTLDHSSTATAGKILKADANGLPIDATNTDTEVSGAVSNSHAQVHTHLLTAGATDVTSSAAELNTLDGYTGSMANFNTLTNDSMADALHRHSELSASDGTPNPALQVDATGKVGISTTTPAAALHVVGSGTEGTIIMQTTSDALDNVMSWRNVAGTQIWRIGLDNGVGTTKWAIGRSNNTADFVINSSGNIGIGTTAPGSKLQIESAVFTGFTLPALGANGVGLSVLNVGGQYGLLAGVQGSGNAFLQAQCVDGTATAYNMLLQPNGGNVGIGTTTPKSVLHVVGLPIYANNAAAVAGGLTAGAFYRPNYDPDPVCVVH